MISGLTDPETDSDPEDESDAMDIDMVANCSHTTYMPTMRVGEGVLISQSHRNCVPVQARAHSLVSSATHTGHNIS